MSWDSGLALFCLPFVVVSVLIEIYALIKRLLVPHPLRSKANATGEMELDGYVLIPRDKAALLAAMMKHLAGDARISFEGYLSNCQFPPMLCPSSTETDILDRIQAWPRCHFVVLPLTSSTVLPILDVVLPDGRFMKDIIHIQIEKGGKLEFGAYDNFDSQCVGCWLGVSVEFLDELKQEGVIDSWAPHYKKTAR